MSQFTVGQRYISNLDASLGLGLVAELEGRRVSIYFPATQEERQYATDQAALTRIQYESGEAIETIDGLKLTVANAMDNNGLIIYEAIDEQQESHIIPETELSHLIQFSQPKQRLLNGLLDSPKAFNLRAKALELKHRIATSSVTGLLGPRVQLLPHQLYIAQRVAERPAPRVLLADEVGLGKTIEAGLIIHHQLITERAERVLIVVPDSLLHQWLVEMLRRFNINSSVIDEEMCQALGESYDNPFEAHQLNLCPLSLFIQHEDRLEQAAQCHWDLFVVDEAHHLAYSAKQVSVEYTAVEKLAAVSTGLLLLTATPEQAGVESHFARLRLLDPDRYHDLESFLEEENQYHGINELLIDIQEQDFTDLTSLTPEINQKLEQTLTPIEVENIQRLIYEEAGTEAKNFCINALLDRHGTGRVLFRNTRQAVPGFPERKLIQHPLILEEAEISHGAPIKDILQTENLLGENWLSFDERVFWLVDFLKEHSDEKILLITAQAETAIALEEFLRFKHALSSSVFHEHMSLIQRDRAAAYFSDSEEGAQILICSEIGSEGRNFQFASHLVLFDLPLNPDLLEQRIGRLDRIGQTQDIKIHIPFYENTAQAPLVRWYHEGLNAFEKTCSFGHSLFVDFWPRIEEALSQEDYQDIESLISDTKKAAEEYRTNIEADRNKLLELNSCRHDEAEDIIDNMLAIEDRSTLSFFIEHFCDQFGVEIEAHSANTIHLRQGDHQRITLPMLDEEGFTATYSRETALSRDDIHFLNWEHPFVNEAFDAILNGDHGNTNVSAIKVKGIPAGSILLEAIYEVDIQAPKYLELGRFLEQSHLRVLINQQGKDLASLLPEEKLKPQLEKIPTNTAQAMIKKGQELVAGMCKLADKAAEKHLPTIIDDALSTMQSQLQDDMIRLKALQEINPSIQRQDLDFLEEKRDALTDILGQANLQAQGLRLIIAT